MGDIQTQLPVAYTTDGTNTVQVFGTGTVAALWVHPDGTGTIIANAGSGTFTVNVANSPTVTANAGSGTFTVTGTVSTTGTTTVTVSNTPTVVSNAGSGTFTVSALANEAAATTGTITTPTSSIIAPVSGYTKVLVTIHGSYTGVTFGLSLSDDGGTTYYPVEGMTTDFQSVGTSFTPGSNATTAYYVQVGGADHLQVLASAWSTGTANIRITPVNDPAGPYVYVTNTLSVTPTGTQTVVVANTPTVIANAGSGTFSVGVVNTPTVVANAGSGTFSVGVVNTPTVIANAGSGTFSVGIVNTPTVVANAGSGTFTVTTAAGTTVTANAGSGTFTVTGTVSTTPGEDTTGIVHQYGTVASVAANGTGTITYTVSAGKTLYLKTVQSSSSGGPCKVTVAVGSTATVIATGFYTSATLERQIFFTQPFAVATGVVVFLITQNNANQSQDIYGFINGHEQ